MVVGDTREAKRESETREAKRGASRYGKLSGAEDLHDLGANLDDVDASLQLRDAAALHVVVFRLGVVEQIDEGSGIYLAGALIHADGELGGSTPVSYTHLDVYKRQPYSYVLEDDDKDSIAELYVVDDDTIIVGGDLMDGLDEDLDHFFNQLMDEHC